MVRNQLAPEHMLETIQRHGLNYDDKYIYQAVQSELLDICSMLTAHEIMFSYYDQLNELIMLALEVENHRLQTNVNILSVVILEKPKAPESIEAAYKAEAQAKADTKAMASKKELVYAEKERDLIEAQGNSAIMAEKANAENDRKLLAKRSDITISMESIEAERRESLIKHEIKLAAAQTEAKSNILIAESLAPYWNNAGHVTMEVAKQYASNSKLILGADHLPKAVYGSNPFNID
jgi:regulator of protease activity HflC (stomatin/prohibitin superfamily)